MPQPFPGQDNLACDDRFEQLTTIMREGMLLVRPGGLVCFASPVARDQYLIFPGDTFTLPPLLPDADHGSLFTTANITHADGATSSFPATMQLRKTEWQGEPAFLVLLHDSSASERANQALEQSEFRYRVVVEQQASLVIRYRPDLTITYANPSMCKALQLSREALVGSSLAQFVPAEERAVLEKQVNSLVERPCLMMFERRLLAADGSLVRLEMTDHALLSAAGKVSEIQSVGRAVEAPEEPVEEDYRDLVENSAGLICRYRPDGSLLYGNEAFHAFFGMRRGGLKHLSLFDLVVEEQRSGLREQLLAFSSGGAQHTLEFEVISASGERRWTRWIATSVVRNGQMEMQSIGLDITEEARTGQRLHLSEQRFLDMLASIQMVAVVIDLDGVIHFANQFFLQLSGYQRDEVLGKVWCNLMLLDKDRLLIRNVIRRIQETGKAPAYGESHIVTRSGELRLIGWNTTLLHDPNGQIISIACIGEDITERSRSQKLTGIIHRISQGANSLRTMDELYRLIHSSLAEVMPVENFFIAEIDDLRNEIHYPYYVDQYDPKPEPKPISAERGMTDYVLRTGKALLASPEVFDQLVAAGEIEPIGAPAVDWLGVPLRTGRRTIGVMVAQSYTEGVRFGQNELQVMDFVSTQVAMAIERKRAENALRDNEEKYRALVEAENNAIFLETIDGQVLDCNTAACTMLGYTKSELLQLSVRDLIPADQAAMMAAQAEVDLQTGGHQWECANRRKDGSTIPVEVSTRTVEIGGRILIVVFVRDLTLRRRREREMEAIAGVSAALRTAITSQDILPVVLQQLVDRLSVHGAFITLMGKHRRAGRVELACGTWSALSGQRLPARRTVCQQVIESGRMYVNDHAADDPLFPFPELVDGVKAIASAPLIAQGAVFGVLTVGYDRAIQPDELHILTAISDIAASAIHRAQLFEQTSRQAADLARAYDATIEGWARALELRDKETQGHSRRVTEMTLKLAAAMQLPAKDMIHIRRGVLLHDIGKMGIPDAILLKPGSLSDEEWITMRKHPEYAREMLAGIGYLGPAIDIPYCHHEKWDGTGYPRKLKGEEIPLYARIFSIVDVMDALTSSRPYRPAWRKQEALEYIQRQSGAQFDPRVVETFLRLFR